MYNKNWWNKLSRKNLWSELFHLKVKTQSVQNFWVFETYKYICTILYSWRHESKIKKLKMLHNNECKEPTMHWHKIYFTFWDLRFWITERKPEQCPVKFPLIVAYDGLNLFCVTKRINYTQPWKEKIHSLVSDFFVSYLLYTATFYYVIDCIGEKSGAKKK